MHLASSRVGSKSQRAPGSSFLAAMNDRVLLCFLGSSSHLNQSPPEALSHRGQERQLPFLKFQ